MRARSFIQYALPVWASGKPPKPSPEEGGKSKPRPITTLAVGEEGGSGGSVTSMALGEEGGSAS